MRIKESDYAFMGLALKEAKVAYEAGEIPVGAVVVYKEQVIAAAHNEKEARQDATAHAELLALQQAARALDDWCLQEVTLYCTLEPCPMCAGAMLNARLGKLVYAVRDEKAGAAGSIIDMLRYPGLNHQVNIEFGVRQDEAIELLQSFFKSIRRDGRAGRRRSTRNRVGG